MLTLMPAAVASRIAGMPSGFAGILINAFGRSTAFQNRFASATVALVSRAMYGDTSSETKPSRPPSRSKSGRKTSQAACTSSTAMVS